jgi:hypothetical protein
MSITKNDDNDGDGQFRFFFFAVMVFSFFRLTKQRGDKLMDAVSLERNTYSNHPKKINTTR